MKIVNNKFYITIYFLLGWISVVAQTYPVQVSTVVLPPYSVHLSDYTTSEKLAVNVLFNDPVRFELTVKLKVTIEGKNITLSTKQEFNPKPIYLQSGFPERLTGIDLAPYFEPNNLNFQGLDRRAFEQTGALPEGVYRICIEVWEYGQNKKVSNAGCSTVWMILNDPPIINYPKNGEKIKILDPQLVIFNWTPRHTGSPNAAFSTEYDFELVEVRAANQNPNNAILSSPPIYTTTTQSTSLYYSIAETPLIPGQKYAFRVRAKAIAGVDELDLFKNKGYSEVFAFTYGDLCLTPDAIHLESINPTSVKATWVSLPAHTSFAIRYRENKEGSEWFEKNSMVPEFTITGLRPETEYAVQVVGMCGVVLNEEIKTYTIKTKKVDESKFACGATPDKIDISKLTLIKSLSPGQFIESSNFKIALIEVTSTGDGFSGRGIAYIPWFKLAGLKVEFKDIQVNEDRKVIKGNVVSTKSANSNWVHTSKEPTPGDASGNGSGNGTTNGGTGNGSGKDTTRIIILANNPTIIVDSITGNTVITDDKGKVTVVQAGEKVTLKDTNGNEQVIVGGSAIAGSGSNSGNNSGSGGTTNGGSGTVQTNWSPETGKFGPIQVTFSEAPVAAGKDEKGNCAYKAKGSFDANLTEGLDISKTVHFTDVVISYTKNCETDKLVGAGFTWQNAAGIDAGKLGVVSVSAHSLDLFLTVDGEAKGKVELKAFLNQDIKYSELSTYKVGNLDFVVKAGLGGNFSFGFEKNNLIADKISGSWDFSGISKVNFDLLKGKEMLAQLKDAKVDVHGVVTGKVTTDYPISYVSDYYKIQLEKASLELSMKIYKGIESWEINGGKIQSKVSDIKNITGEITCDLIYGNDEFKGTSTSAELSSFGMTLSNVKLTANFDKQLVFKSMIGSFDAKHAELNNAVLNVTRFELTPEGIQAFNVSGEFTYKGQNVKLQETTYDKQLDALVGIASITSGTGADKKVLSIDGFKIYRDGRIDMGEVTGSFDSGESFGPLRITMDIPQSKSTDEQGYKVYEDVTCSFLLNLTAGNKSIKEIAVKNVKISYKKHPETLAYKDVHAVWEGDLDLGSVGIVSGKMKKFDLNVDANGNLSGVVTLDAYSNADVSITELLTPGSTSDLDIIVKKGLTGNFNFKFSNQTNFSGKWDFNNLKNINANLIKSNQLIAQIKDGNVNDQEIFTGTLNTVENVSYKSNLAKVAFIEMNMGFSVSLVEGKSMETFKVTSGGAKVEITEMEGLTGSMVFGLSYHTDQTMQGSVVQTEKSTIKAFGMEMKQLNLLSIWDMKFNLKEISGSVRLVNESLGYGYFALKEFKIVGGRLTTCKGEGKMTYKGFLFDLENINYTSKVNGTSLLTADAKLLWKIGSKLQKVSVDKFTMDANGEIEVGRLKGNLKANESLYLTFDAAFEDNRFVGTFNANLGLIKFDGTMDGGSALDAQKEKYNFGYLGILTTLPNGGVPLGATGFKLTKLGGKLGLNYKLNVVAANTTNSAPGNPAKDNYVLGLDLGIADDANIFEVSANTSVTIGEGNMKFDLTGELKMPNAASPTLYGTLNVKYFSPEEEMTGKLTAQIKIPASTGNVFSLNSMLDFGYKKKNWTVKGNGTGSLFNAINFTGAVDFKNSTAGSTTPFIGSIEGAISYAKNISSKSGYHFLSFGVDVSSTLQLGFNQNLKIALTEQGLESDFTVMVSGKAGLTVTGATTYTIDVTGSANMQVSYKNEEAKINGQLKLEVLTGDKKGEQYETTVDLTL